MCALSETNVVLGYLDEIDPKRLHSRWFPSKAGGKPAWLALKDLPSMESLTCTTCSNPTTFLAQIYAPDEQSDSGFHRTIFVFVCRTPNCQNPSVTAWRSQIPRRNEFYPYEPPTEGNDFEINLELCSVCGCLGGKKCGKCHKTKYCSRYHQVTDWKNGHKENCGSDENTVSKILYNEFIIKIEAEEIEEENKTTEEGELDKFKKMVEEGRIGTLDGVDEKEFDSYAAGIEQDKIFDKFKKRIEHCPDQVIRYQRNGEPLPISKELNSEIPVCDYCNSPRSFEFQILPQILYELEEDNLDFGTLIVYTCSKSCSDDKTVYRQEFVFKQNIV